MAVDACSYAFFERGLPIPVPHRPRARHQLVAMERLRMPGLQAAAAAGVPQVVRRHHAGLLPAELLARGRRVHRAGRGLPGHFPGRPRRPSLDGACAGCCHAARPVGLDRHDLLLGVADVAITGMWAVTGSLRRPRTPRSRTARCTLRVVGRQVVAHDENVVALTLADRRSPAAAALASGRAPRHSPAQRPGPAVLTVRRPGGAGHLPDRGAPHPRRRRRVHRGARRAGGRVPRSPPAARETPSRSGSPATDHRRGGSGSSPAASGSPRSCRCWAWPQRLGVDWSMVYVGRSREQHPLPR